MTLAGNMKLKNFVLIALAAVAAASLGLYAACSGKHEDKHEAEQKKASAAALATPDAAPAPPPSIDAAVAAPPPAAPVDLAAREWDTEALAWKGRTISGDKVKDAVKGKSWKLNVYKDAGSTSVDRVKIDTNKNNKWDEKISFDKDGQVTLERAPADDEKYTEKYHWNGAGWIKAK